MTSSKRMKVTVEVPTAFSRVLDEVLQVHLKNCSLATMSSLS